MIDAGKSGYFYPCGDTDALARILKKALASQELQHLKEGVRRQMESWTKEEFLDCWVDAVDAAVLLKRNSKEPQQ